MSATISTGRPSVSAVAVGAFVLALFAGAMWGAWLGWDHEYYEVDGVSQGPYRAWQVIGCAVSILVAAVVAQLWTRRMWTVLVLAPVAVVGFAIPWAVDAAGSDDSGLFIVGLFFLLVGGVTGLVIVLTVVAAVAESLSRRTARP